MKRERIICSLEPGPAHPAGPRVRMTARDVRRDGSMSEPYTITLTDPAEIDAAYREAMEP